jgi:biofilm PGA synthesis N-glycosyltransferase PgaC
LETSLTVCVVVLIAILAYTYFGYPVMIGLLARMRPYRARTDADRAASTDTQLPHISICLPVYNGVTYLPAKIESLLKQDYPADRVEILIYCDGCSDDTEALARRIAESPEAGGRIRVFADARRLGKPTGLNTLGPAARGELLLLNDVRQPLSPNALRALSAPLGDPRVGGATGNLVLAGGAGSGVYWRYETWIREQESRFHGMVGMTGPIAMIRRADLKPLPADLILDDVWIPMQLALAGKRFAFVGDAQAYDAAFENEREFQRKVRTLAGNYQLFAKIPALLVPGRNPLWFETLSHKILRLVAPWVMMALAAVTLVGVFGGRGVRAAPWLTALLIAQLAFYGVAGVGKRAGKLAGVARTFVVLNAAAVIGLWRFLTGRQRVTW